MNYADRLREQGCGCVKDGRDGTVVYYCHKHDLESRPIFKWLLAAIIVLAMAMLFGELSKRAEARANATTVKGQVKSTAYVMTRFDSGPLREFVVKFDLPDIPNPEGWR